MAEEERKNRRFIKNFWLEPEFQGKVGVYVVCYGLINVFLFSGFFYYWNQKMIEGSTFFFNSSSGLGDLSHFHFTLGQALMSFVFMQVILIAFTFLAAIFFSHRISGPAYAMVKTMKEFREGQIEKRVRTRKNDDLTELRDEINLLLDHVSPKKT